MNTTQKKGTVSVEFAKAVLRELWTNAGDENSDSYRIAMNYQTKAREIYGELI